MRIAVLVFDGFDDLGTFGALGLLGRVRAEGFGAQLAGVAAEVRSADGLRVQVPQPLEWANQADAVLFAGSHYARALAENRALIDRLELDPLRQSICAQGSGALLLARLGLLGDQPACADAATRPWLVEAGVRVSDAPFHARGPVASAGDGLAAHYLAVWLMLRGAGEAATVQALQHAAPAADEPAFTQRLLAVVRPFVRGPS